jgi:predicted  nucleic acid-binding Zn-ribbon protein
MQVTSAYHSPAFEAAVKKVEEDLESSFVEVKQDVQDTAVRVNEAAKDATPTFDKDAMIDELQKQVVQLKAGEVLWKIEQAALFSTVRTQNERIVELQQQIIDQQIQFTKALADVNARCAELQNQYLECKTYAQVSVGISLIATGAGLISSTIGWAGLVRVLQGGVKSLQALTVAKVTL